MPTYDYFPFDSGLGANSTESRWRTMFQKMKATGIAVEGSSMDASADNCAVSAGSGMTVTIVPGKAFIKGHFFSHTGTNETLAIGSNTSGSTRTDLVVIRCDFVNNTMGYLVLQGTTTPVQNANVWDLPLCNVAVPNSASSASSFTFTDRRVFACDPSLVPSVRKYSSASQTLASSAYTNLNLNTGSFWITDPKLYPGTDLTKIVIPQDGFYLFQGRITVSGTPIGSDNANDRRGIRIMLNGSQTVSVLLIPNRTQAMELVCSGFWRCIAGDYVQLQGYQTTNAAGTYSASLAELGCHFLNPISV
jgi:hypothetical protein